MTFEKLSLFFFFFCRQRRRREEAKSFFFASPRARTSDVGRSRPRLSTSWLCGRKNAGTGPRKKGPIRQLPDYAAEFFFGGLSIFFSLTFIVFGRTPLFFVFFSIEKEKVSFSFFSSTKRTNKNVRAPSSRQANQEKKCGVQAG